MKHKKIILFSTLSFCLSACGTPSIADVFKNTDECKNLKITYTSTTAEGENKTVYTIDGDKIKYEINNSVNYTFVENNKTYAVSKSVDGKYYKMEVTNSGTTIIEKHNISEQYNLSDQGEKFEFKDNAYTLKDGENIFKQQTVNQENGISFTSECKIYNVKITLDGDKISLYELDLSGKRSDESEYKNKVHIKYEFDYSKQTVTIPEAELSNIE